MTLWHHEISSEADRMVAMTVKVGMSFRECLPAVLRDQSTDAWGGTSLMDSLLVSEVSEGRCVHTLTVEASHTNMMGSLHGGCSMTLVDICSTVAMMTIVAPPSVSVDLSTQFASGASVGDVLRIVSTVDRKGRTLCFTRVQIFNDSTGGKLVAQGLHTKFLMGSSL